MRNYAKLTTILKGLKPPLTEAVVTSMLAPCLVETWLNDYGSMNREYDVVETKDEGFSYLFDISAERYYRTSPLRDCRPEVRSRQIPSARSTTEPSF